MVTKYDVFARVIEKAPIKQKELNFSVPVYAHLKSLQKDNLITLTSKGYTPLKNPKSIILFEIIKKSIKTGLNYNLFLSKEIINILEILSKNLPNLRPEEIKNNYNIQKILKYLEENQFILLRKNKPKVGTLLIHSIFDLIQELEGKKIVINEVYANYSQLREKILKIPQYIINPFEKDYFAYLTGSVQLEGSTVTIGETIDILTKEIYPEKHLEEIQMVKNLNEAMQFVINNIDKKLESDDIKELNKRVMFSLHRGAGEYKKAQNKIAGNPSFKTTEPKFVVSEIVKFCDEFNSISSREECLDKIGKIHNDFQRIHPFPDGNSRTTRILVNWLLVRFGFPLLILKSGAFEKYMSLTKLSKKAETDNLRLFILHVLLHENL